MLKNNEPYRYANPTTTQLKLSRLRVAVTGEHRKPEHKGGRHGVKNGENPPSRRVPSLGTVCEQEGLPPAHGFEELPAGEQRVLKSLGVIDYVDQIHQNRREPCRRKPRSKAANNRQES